MKNDSTPSEGWEGATRQCVEANIYSGDSNLQKIDYIMAHIGTVLKHETAKAQQEITDWSLERQEKAYRMGIDIGRQEERREIADKLKDACIDYCFTGDGSSDSSEETMRMSEYIIKHMGLEHLEE